MMNTLIISEQVEGKDRSVLSITRFLNEAKALGWTVRTQSQTTLSSCWIEGEFLFQNFLLYVWLRKIMNS